MVRLVSISGAAGSGKDYLADYLVTNHGFRRLKFADPLYQSVAVITGLTVEQVAAVKEGNFRNIDMDYLPPGKTLAETQNAMRLMLQQVGTEIGRQMWREDNWVHQLMTRIDSTMRGDDMVNGIVVTDARFPNEFDSLEARGFLMVDVQAPDEYLRINREDPKWNHPSERALDGYRAKGRFHVTIHNDRSMDAKEMLLKALPWPLPAA